MSFEKQNKSLDSDKQLLILSLAVDEIPLMWVISFSSSCSRLHSFGCFPISAACFCFSLGLLEVFYFFHLLFLALGSFVSLERPGTGARRRKVARPSLLLLGRTFPRSSGCRAVEGTCVHLQVCDKYKRKWCQFAKRNGNNNQSD